MRWALGVKRVDEGVNRFFWKIRVCPCYPWNIWNIFNYFKNIHIKHIDIALIEIAVTGTRWNRLEQLLRECSSDVPATAFGWNTIKLILIIWLMRFSKRRVPACSSDGVQGGTCLGPRNTGLSALSHRCCSRCSRGSRGTRGFFMKRVSL